MKKNLLIVEDDDIQIFIFKKYLSKLNEQINHLKFSANGLEALDYIKANLNTPEILPDLILLDINMPLLDGWQFLGEFNKLEISKDIKIKILSSSDHPSDLRRAQSFDLKDNYYVKPISFEQLTGIIEV